MIAPIGDQDTFRDLTSCIIAHPAESNYEYYQVWRANFAIRSSWGATEVAANEPAAGRRPPPTTRTHAGGCPGAGRPL